MDCRHRSARPWKVSPITGFGPAGGGCESNQGGQVNQGFLLLIGRPLLRWGNIWGNVVPSSPFDAPAASCGAPQTVLAVIKDVTLAVFGWPGSYTPCTRSRLLARSARNA